MLKTYLLIAYRSIRKNTAHALVNVAGLAIGITCSLVIFLIVRFELSFDDHHQAGDRIFRVVTEFTKAEEPGYSSGVTYPLAEAMRQDFADLENVSLVDANLYTPVV